MAAKTNVHLSITGEIRGLNAVHLVLDELADYEDTELPPTTTAPTPTPEF